MNPIDPTEADQYTQVDTICQVCKTPMRVPVFKSQWIDLTGLASFVVCNVCFDKRHKNEAAKAAQREKAANPRVSRDEWVPYKD